MITGLFSDLSAQKSFLPAAVVQALEVLQQQDLSKLEPGRYEIDGDKLFYMVQDAIPRMLNASKSEAHYTYADIQTPLTARERLGVSLPQAGLAPSDDRLEANDIAFYPNPANEFFIDLDPGAYAVFMPGELHRPCVAISDQTPYRKIVVKVHRSLLGL